MKETPGKPFYAVRKRLGATNASWTWCTGPSGKLVVCETEAQGKRFLALVHGMYSGYADTELVRLSIVLRKRGDRRLRTAQPGKESV